MPTPWILASLIGVALHSPLAQVSGEAPGQKGLVTAITNVSVVPMTGGPDLSAHTVVVTDGRITALGPAAELTVPPGATVIDGTGKWLSPGLVDFHTHERGFPSWPDDVAGNFIMYLANGITTIVNMGDFTGGLLRYREAVRSGALPGPRAFVGQIVRGPADGGFPVVANAADAARVAREARIKGYDFLKVYGQLPAEAFDPLVAAARSERLPVTGHRSPIGLLHAITHGQLMVAHTAEFLGLVGAGDDEALARLAETVAGSGAAVTATLHVWQVVQDFGLDAIAGRDLNERLSSYPGTAYMDDAALAAWRGVLQSRPDIRSPQDRRPAGIMIHRLTRAFHRAGVPLLMGSDNIGAPAVVPGYSIQAEMRLLTEAGIPRADVLAIGTRNAGRFIAREFGTDPMGVVAVGAIADLVLHAVDPRTDLASFGDPAGVMAAGRWYPSSWLAEQLERLRTSR